MAQTAYGTGDGAGARGTYGAAHTPEGAGAQGAHGAGAHDAHHDVSHDKGAAYMGLVAGLVLIGSLLFGMVEWTNHHLNAAEGGKPAAGATK